MCVSAASSWEMSIKKALGKINIPDNIENIVEDKGFEKLPVTFCHGQLAGALPDLRKDPFDRMLIAQAQAEGLLLAASVSAIFKYSLQLMDATR